MESQILLIFALILGATLGSFINSAVYRVYQGLSLWEFSHCPKCKKRLQAVDLIPLFSFLWQKAKCRYCREKISWHYFALEFCGAVFFALLYLKHGAVNAFLIRDLLILLVLLFVLTFDWQYYLILDKIIYPALAGVIIVNLFLGESWISLLIGMAIGFGFFFLQYLLTSAKGIGLGDVKLGLLCGAILGAELILVAIFIAYIVGGIIAAYLLISKKKQGQDHLPLGAFLSLATIISMIYGQAIINYLFL